MIATSSLVLHAIILTGFSLVDALALVLPQLIESNRVVVTRSTSLFHHRPPGSHDDRRCALRRIAIASASSIATATSTSTKANAITPQQASTSYDKYAANYNALDGGSIATSLGIDDARKQLLSQAYGNVLEIGAGTGLNLDSYRFVGDDSAITSLTLVDISEGMLSVAKAHAEEIQQQYRQRQLLSNNSSTNQLLPSIKFVKADATSELIPLFGENAFDTVVDTFSLCVMGNEGARKCLREMRGVVKKGGAILLVENTRSSNPILGYYQDVTASTAADMGGKGCLYNQNVGEMIQQTNGLHLVKEVEFATGFFRSFVVQKDDDGV